MRTLIVSLISLVALGFAQRAEALRQVRVWEVNVSSQTDAAVQAQSGLRQVLDRLLDRTETLVVAAQGLLPRVQAGGLRRESAAIVALAGRLAHRLRRGDPLASRVKLTKSDFAAAFLSGIFAPRRR